MTTLSHDIRKVWGTFGAKFNYRPIAPSPWFKNKAMKRLLEFDPNCPP